MHIEEKKLIDCLSLQKKECISIVGGGGKTSLAGHLSRELYNQGKSVISTTTTKIFPPQTGERETLIFAAEQYWLNKIDNAIREEKLIHLAVEILSKGKLKGLTKKHCKDIMEKTNINYLIIEADGSNGKSIKAHSTWEPVVPEFTTTFISVIGIDCLMAKIDDKNVHRAKIFNDMLEINKKSIIDIDIIINLFNHPMGYLKTLPSGARSFVYINKVHEYNDTIEAIELGKKLILLEKINGIIIGHMKPPSDKFTFITK